jgi:ATP adenylyltransferase
VQYIKAEAPEGCFFCTKAREDDDEQNHVIWRGRSAFVLLNTYPYNNGHLLVSPIRHEGRVEALTPEELAAMMRDSARAQGLLARVLHAHGFNWGLNVGRCAGAGLVDHLHMHIVPRWDGDTNFMPVLADVKIIPQALEDLHEKLVAALND